jgi:hypothetical protein
MLRKMAGPGKSLGYHVTRIFVICVGYLVLLGQRNEECVQKFGGETAGADEEEDWWITQERIVWKWVVAMGVVWK